MYNNLRQNDSITMAKTKENLDIQYKAHWLEVNELGTILNKQKFRL